MIKYRIKTAFPRFRRFLFMAIFQPVSESGLMDTEQHHFIMPRGSSHGEEGQQRHKPETTGQCVPTDGRRHRHLWNSLAKSCNLTLIQLPGSLELARLTRWARSSFWGLSCTALMVRATTACPPLDATSSPPVVASPSEELHIQLPIWRKYRG